VGSHALGAARALLISEKAGAFAALGLTLTAVVTSFAFAIFAKFAGL
jgi:putative effector of murein hydrolase